MRITKCGIDIVRGCQLRCVGCPISGLRTKIEYMPVERFQKILSNINVSKIELLRLFNFGEPMLHPELVKLVRQIPRHFKGIVDEVELSTNAQVLRPSDIRKIMHDGIVTRIAVSCDGDGTPEEFERLRPPAKFDKLMEFVRFVGLEKRRTQSNIELVTRTVLTGTGPDRIRWRRLMRPHGFEPLFRGRFQLSNSVDFHRPDTIPGGLCRFLSGAKGKRLYVDVDGTVVPCCRHPRAFAMGNILDVPFKQLITTKTYRTKVEDLRLNRGSIPICAECEKT